MPAQELEADAGATGRPAMKPRVFEGFRDLAQDLAGISLREGNDALVRARVAGRLRALALPSEEAYLALLKGAGGAEERVHFLDAISTGFTSFWREPEHFADLVEQTRLALTAGCRRFRFWSAACSSGEEPYSMAIALEGVFGDLEVDWKILATDLSVERLTHAVLGKYTADEVAPLDAVSRAANFVPGGNHPAFGPLHQVRPALRHRVLFRRLNLAQPPYPMRGPLDAVFCRNVMFYFEPPTRQALVGQIERLLRPGGTAYIGRSETLSQLETGLVTVRPSVFRKPRPEGG
jgi:chemotaxis protein methyltransferase CheR